MQYEGIEFFINIDQVQRPALGYYLEIKSRTWSRQDAKDKSRLAVELIELLGATTEEATSEDYLDMIR